MSDRPKPWYRPRNVYLAVLAGLYGWLGSIVYWAYTVKPNRANIVYAERLSALSASLQPPGENGWPDLERAARRLLQKEPDLVIDQKLFVLLDAKSFDADKALA